MAEPMTTETCDMIRDRCSTRVFAAIETVRVANQTEIRLIRESVQNIDRAVAQIKGYLNLNGGPLPAHPHHRDNEETDRLHQRMTDAIAAAELAAGAATKATAAAAANANRDPDAMPALPWKAWAAIGVAFLLFGALAMVAGRDGLTVWPKAHQAVPSLVK